MRSKEDEINYQRKPNNIKLATIGLEQVPVGEFYRPVSRLEYTWLKNGVEIPVYKNKDIDNIRQNLANKGQLQTKLDELEQLGGVIFPGDEINYQRKPNNIKLATIGLEQVPVGEFYRPVSRLEYTWLKNGVEIPVYKNKDIDNIRRNLAKKGQLQTKLDELEQLGGVIFPGYEKTKVGTNSIFHQADTSKRPREGVDNAPQKRQKNSEELTPADFGRAMSNGIEF